MYMSNSLSSLPELPLDAWERSKITLHLYSQIVGKIRLKMTPRKNHWWYLTLYVSPKGLTTHAIPYMDGYQTFEITLNFLTHQLEVVTSRGDVGSIPLEDGLSVSQFYHQLFALLKQFDIPLKIVAVPFDVPNIDKPFADITEYHSYQKEYIERFWRIMMWVDGVFKEFSGRFYGKTCPVHLYWHHMDLAVTRFSGKKGPAMAADARLSDKDAYTHEVISFGFWAGDETVRGAAFYGYAYPSPEGLDKEPLHPGIAQWVDNNGSAMAMLMYDDLRKEANPRQALLEYLESAYQAAAKLADWDVEELTVPPLEEL
jgi:hypothetical protein